MGTLLEAMEPWTGTQWLRTMTATMENPDRGWQTMPQQKKLLARQANTPTPQRIWEDCVLESVAEDVPDWKVETTKYPVLPLTTVCKAL